MSGSSHRHGETPQVVTEKWIRKEFSGVRERVKQEKKLRDCKEINFTVPEEKNGSDLEDFSAAGVPSHPCKGKSSRDESIFPSRTVKVISLRSLTYPC